MGIKAKCIVKGDAERLGGSHNILPMRSILHCDMRCSCMRSRIPHRTQQHQRSMFATARHGKLLSTQTIIINDLKQVQAPGSTANYKRTHEIKILKPYSGIAANSALARNAAGGCRWRSARTQRW